MEYRINIEALVEDLGGASHLAKSIGVPRTAPYGWIRRKYISGRVLEQIKTAYPQVDIDAYFEVTNDKQARRSA